MPRGGIRAGAGMPPKYGEPTVRRSLRIPKSLDALVCAEAKRKKISITDQIIFMLLGQT